MKNGADIYKRYVDGDDNALGEIVEIYSDNLLLFINGFVHNINDSEDIMSDTFLELIVKRNHFRGQSDFKTYLYRIGRNKAVDFIRKKERNSRKNHMFAESVESNDETEKAITDKEKRQKLYESLNRLPGQYREVLYLLYFEEMKLDEVSVVLKKKKKQVENIEYRAKKALKKQILDDNYFIERNLVDENISAENSGNTVSP